jgi:hypothetical protein
MSGGRVASHGGGSAYESSAYVARTQYAWTVSALECSNDHMSIPTSRSSRIGDLSH